MAKLKYFKSKVFPGAYFYECCNCGLDLKPGWLEMCSGTNCKSCGAKITQADVANAKEAYIKNLEKYTDEKQLETLAEIIVYNALNKTRDYHGRSTRESNDFFEELKKDTIKYILNHTED